VIEMTNDYKPTGWHSRGYLPHFDAGEVFQSITFRLADSMPQTLLEQWKRDLATESADFEEELHWRIEAYLDRGYGACYLSNARIANLVPNALLHFDRERYRLSAWVLMPNHVHLLAAPWPCLLTLRYYAFNQVLYFAASKQDSGKKRPILVRRLF
jgi:hypothetical protein